MQNILPIIVTIQIVFILYIAWRVRYHVANPLYLGLFFLYKILFAILPIFASISVNIWLSEMTGLNNISLIAQEFLVVFGLFALLIASGYSISEKLQFRRDTLGLTFLVLLFLLLVFAPSILTDDIYIGLQGEYFEGNTIYWVTKVLVFFYGSLVHILVGKNLIYYIITESDSRMVARWSIGLIVLSLSIGLSSMTTTYIVSVAFLGLNSIGRMVTIVGLVLLPLLLIFDVMFFYIPETFHRWFLTYLIPYRDTFVYQRLNEIVEALRPYGKPYIVLGEDVDYMVKIPLAKNTILDLMDNAKDTDSHGKNLYRLLEPCQSLTSDLEQIYFLVQASSKVKASNP